LFSSVAHGSGHDIVGKGVASPAAMIEAISRLANVATVAAASDSAPTRMASRA
jgi:isocitrate/isopropylmalate dehydrogenase